MLESQGVGSFNPYPANVFVHFRLDFIMETNTMNPDQTASLGAV